METFFPPIHQFLVITNIDKTNAYTCFSYLQLKNTVLFSVHNILLRKEVIYIISGLDIIQLLTDIGCYRDLST